LVERKYFEEMNEQPFIGLVIGQLDQHDRPFIKVLGIDLPMSDGHSVSHVLSAHIEIDAEETIESKIPNAPITRYF
jgi:hypothetical protein